MKRLNRIVLLALLSLQSLAYADVTQYFSSIQSDPNALYAFFEHMPKGGELHYHLAGSAYPETMLAIAAKNNYCFDKTSWAISKTVEACHGISARELTKHRDAYNQVIRAWSMKDFIAGSESGHDHFFASFYKFLPIVVDHDDDLLVEVMRRAAAQHEQYLEIMILPDNANSTRFAVEDFSLVTMETAKKQLLANSDFQANIQDTIRKSHNLLEAARHKEGCATDAKQDVCKLTVKFQYYVLREQGLKKVFAQALNGFAAAAQSSDIVGINLVQAEDGFISLRDYHKQMEIFKFLHQAYPQVHIDLHAGELAPQAVTPENTRFHIHDAIYLGHAERIGHGVDIAHENNAERLMQAMHNKGIAVEINLISNKKILAIAGKRHPLHYYLAHHVPVVLSTDDEGILRTDLTEQYVEAVTKHGIDYPTVKQINRNALTYSFLPGKSLWQNAERAIAVSECQKLDSASCLEFINHNQKARVQRQLEIQLTKYESKF